MKVWLLGDSIRLFYEKSVISKLGEEYEVFSPKVSREGKILEREKIFSKIPFLSKMQRIVDDIYA